MKKIGKVVAMTAVFCVCGYSIVVPKIHMSQSRRLK